MNQAHLQDWTEMQLMPGTSQVTLGAFVNFCKLQFLHL